ncbi:MAG: hypothetical protein IJU18_00190 [Oscillospiraceae bacterium]|nr:hypothetical protein [Oscillospiraceae bacterium]
MTLGEAKDKVYMLLDEHSTGGEIEHDEDIEKKMVYFFDIAQKMLSQIKKIVRSKRFTPQPGRTEYLMPTDFRNVYRIWRDGVPANDRYHWRRGRMIVPEGDGAKEIEVEYFACPAAIAPDAGDDYEFELGEDACECMPYYVAAQNLLPDLVLDYSAYMQMFNQMVNLLDTSLPGDALRVRQRYYRGR